MNSTPFDELRQKIRPPCPALEIHVHPVDGIGPHTVSSAAEDADFLLAAALHRAEGGKDNEAGTKTGANAEPPMAHGPWRQHFRQAALRSSCARSRVLSKGNICRKGL